MVALTCFYSVGDVERLSAGSDISPEFTLSLDDGSFLGCAMSDADDVDSLSLRLNRSFSSWTLFNRSSSIYTDSSDDLGSLGEEDRSLVRRLEYGEKDIRKIVEYFERYIRSGGVGPEAVEKATSARSGQMNSNLKARIRQFQNWRHDDKAGREKLLASQLTERLTANSFDKSSGLFTSNSQPTNRTKLVSHRLKVCEGAVQSKLSLFDKKVKSN